MKTAESLYREFAALTAHTGRLVVHFYREPPYGWTVITISRAAWLLAWTPKRRLELVRQALIEVDAPHHRSVTGWALKYTAVVTFVFAAAVLAVYLFNATESK